MPTQQEVDMKFLAEAIAQARKSFTEGGIPIGSVLVVDGNIIGRGHNRRVQDGNPILHGEMDAFQNAGRQPPEVYARATLYTTLSPCTMCGGTAVHYRIPRLVIGENETVAKTTLCEDWLISRDIDVVVYNSQECKDLMAQFIAKFPEVWNEDIGRQHTV